MDNFMKQSRVRFSGVGEEDQYPTRTTYRQGQMNTDGINEAAVAAAAFAILSREEETLLKQKQKEKARTLSRTKSRIEGTVKQPTDTGTESSKFIRWLSGKDAGEDSYPSERRKQDASTTDQRIMEKPKDTGRTPSFKKTPTFSDTYQNEETSKRFGKKQGQEIQPVPKRDKPLGLNSYNRIEGPLPGETKADAWEREKMAKIRASFEKLNLTILEWENEKKKKAKRKLTRKERELEQKRLNAQTEYREEEIRINKIVAGARALAEERKKNDEAKAIEKARKMRTAQQYPKSFCPCF